MGIVGRRRGLKKIWLGVSSCRGAKAFGLQKKDLLFLTLTEILDIAGVDWNVERSNEILKAEYQVSLIHRASRLYPLPRLPSSPSLGHTISCGISAETLLSLKFLASS